MQAAIIALWCLLPVYWMAVASIREPGEVYQNTIWPQHVTFGNYVEAFAPLNLLLPALEHSFGIALVVTLATLLIGTSGAYALARLRFQGRGFLLGALLAGSMTPAVSLVTPLFAFFTTVGWSSSFQALAIPYLALAMPFAVATLSAFLVDMPWELEDSAMVDGCTRGQAFVRVMLPLIAPAIATVGLLTFIATWNDYVIAFVLSVQDTITVTVVIANFNAELTGTAVTMAAGVVASLPLVVLVLVFQRRIAAGLTMGAVKG